MIARLALARRIEDAETVLTRAVVKAVIASGRGPRAFLRELGSGVAAYVRPDSPMNKLIGAGLAAPIADKELEKVETLMRACEEPLRIELSTLSPPEVEVELRARGYRLLGFENVLVRSLDEAFGSAEANVSIERVGPETIALWKRITIDASAHSDHSGDSVDQFSHDVIAEAVEDFLHVEGFERYLARANGEPAGGASLLIHERVAMLGGSATLPEYRLLGVHTALIAARLAEARVRGAEFAVVTTAPGSRSQANMIKRGFRVVYARSILVRD